MIKTFMKNEPQMTTIRIIIVIAIFHIAALSAAQTTFQREKRDHIWLLGYGSNPTNLTFGGTRIDFNQSPPQISYEYRDLDFNATNASMCDEAGNLLFYSNGIAVHNYLNELIENGDGLNPDPYTENWIGDGYPLPQGLLILPDPGAPNRFFLVYSTITVVIPAIQGNNYLPLNCYFASVEISAEGSVHVVEKNMLILSDTLDFGKLTAVRHANGRDWWIAQQEYAANRHYPILLSPLGINIEPVQTTGNQRPTGLGQAVFSPNGKKYAVLSLYGFVGDQFLDIYDFDRCNGIWGNPLPIVYQDTVNGGGIAFSPNSRFLYVSSYHKIYQYDLEADDIEASRVVVAVYDGFESPPPYPTNFSFAQLAPDDKIYINTRSVTTRLHVIHNPNAKGTACQMEQHGVQLPTRNAFGIPNSPFYGLGPEDGSPCDTLGIDHHPQADFRYVAADAEVGFYDYSRFFPTDWSWTFGDGGSSTERDPVHVYAASGVYEVCLIVSNANASDTLCRELEIIITDTQEALTHKPLLKVFPNPAKDYVVLQVVGFEALPRLQALVKLEWVLYDAFGRELRSIQLEHPEAQTIVNLESLSAGMYFWRLEAGGAVLEGGKLIKS